VLAVFKTNKASQIIGGKVLTGKAEKDSLAEVVRNQQIIAAGKIIGLQSGKQDTNVVAESQECGLAYEGEPIIKAGDLLRIYKEVELK
jgi:translation initiation factor IF-2